MSKEKNIKKVDHFATAFNKATREANSYGKLPDGKYVAYCFDAKMFEKDGTLRAYLDYVIAEEDNEDVYGLTGRAFYTIANEEGETTTGAGFLGLALAKLGVMNPEEGIRSQEHLAELLDGINKSPVPCVIEVKERKGYTNIYVLKQIPEDEAPEMPEMEEED